MSACEAYRVPGTNTFRFPSVAEMGRAGAAHCNNDKGWTGESRAETLRFCEHGDPSRVPAAEALLAQIADKVDLRAGMPAWQSDVAGAFVDVPAYLSGSPECMRRKAYQPDERAPVRVLVCTTSSAGIPADKLNARGVAVLALVMALQVSRPVSLAVFTSLDGDRRGDAILINEVGNSPLALSEACFALSSAGFARNLGYGIARALCGYSGLWARCVEPLLRPENRDPACAAMKACRAMLGLTGDNDILIPPALINDPLLNDPVAWIVARLADIARE